MNIAFCYENVLPARGGCETYIADLARRIVADGHELHLYACRWDTAALPEEICYHRLDVPAGPRFLRPWRFGKACLRALGENRHQVSVGFDKTWGQDVLYPQGGLHAASAEHNLRKYPHRLVRTLARGIKSLDLAHRSFSRLERRQYLGPNPPLVVVNSHMVERHFQKYYGSGSNNLRVVHSAIDPRRFAGIDRPKQRQEWRSRWGIKPDETVALFVAMNYRLKGLEPLLHAVGHLPEECSFRLLVAGHPGIEPYERLAGRLGIAPRVVFLGPRRDIQNCYFAADFLVHPTFYDPCSLVVLEALACGLPVITSRYNGASELMNPLCIGSQGRGEIQNGAGFVIDNPHDHWQLAWFMTQFLDPIRRASSAEASRRAADQWTFDHHYRKLMQVFTEAAATKRAA
jgi:UDP-glucose:(heptosyl)LPS alpha-1,3-glucosyltransferase